VVAEHDERQHDDHHGHGDQADDDHRGAGEAGQVQPGRRPAISRA
jgi:hypothetical protein